MDNYIAPDGLKIKKVKEGKIKVSSLYFDLDKNFNKPLNEVSEEIRRRKNPHSFSS